MQRFLLFIFIFIVMNQFSMAKRPSQLDYIKCNGPNRTLLEIEVDKYESLPMLSEIHFYISNTLVIKDKAPKLTISLETDPPQFAYKFILPGNSRLRFLQVNITKQTASLVYEPPKLEPKLIQFEDCFFNQTLSI